MNIKCVAFKYDLKISVPVSLVLKISHIKPVTSVEKKTGELLKNFFLKSQLKSMMEI